MRRIGVFAFLFLLGRPAVSQDVIVAAYGSTGLYPAMSSSYVCRYPEDLQSVRVLMSYPKLSGSPSAALMVGDVLFVGEWNCTRAPGTPDYVTTCAPRLVRFDPDGSSVVFARALKSEPRSIRLSSSGDLVVTMYDEVVRFDRVSGQMQAAYALPVPEHQVVQDADIAHDGCSMAIAISSDGFAASSGSNIVRGNVCGASPAWTIAGVASPGGLRGIRFLPDGTLLAAGRDVTVLDATGGVIRMYDTGSSGGCLIDVNRWGSEAVLACDARVMRLDLRSGEISVPVWSCGAGALSINLAQPDPAGPVRRRIVRH